MTTIVPVILAGGGGARLWPLSTPAKPKQLQALATARTLLQETALRFHNAGEDFAAPVVVTGKAHVAETISQLTCADIASKQVIAEPFGRNTAAAVAVAAHYIRAKNEHALMLVLPADHHVERPQGLRQAVRVAVGAAEDGALVTFGVVPARAETGYGYVEQGAGTGPVFPVASFVEKPPLDVAEKLVAGGRHYWNAGIFLFSPASVLESMEKYAPQVAAAARDALDSGQSEDGTLQLDAAAFGRSPTISIDKAVMERAGKIAVVPIDIGWSDVGSFRALHDTSDQDSDGNASRGFVIAADIHNSYLRADTGVLAAVGLRDLTVIREGNAVLVAPLHRSQEIREIHDRIYVQARGGPAARIGSVDFGPNAARLYDWLVADALPCWADNCWDKEKGGFYETLPLDGTPNTGDEFRRIRVQARQIFVGCAAHEIGLDGRYLEIAQRGFDYLCRHGWQEAGGWAHKLTTDGDVKDPMRDVYDHAFVLFALAALYRVTGDKATLTWVNKTMAYLDAVMGDPEYGGFVESAPCVLPRRANPHMHLLEAFLALFDATGDYGWLSRARQMVQLFRRQFFDTKTGTVGEFFRSDWRTVDGVEGRIREPGHHWEWAFLLHSYESRSGESFGSEIECLTDFARIHGHSGGLGFAFDEVLEDGTVHGPAFRLWPQTEALRGLEMLHKRGGDGFEAKIDSLADQTYEKFVKSVGHKGLFADRLTRNGDLRRAPVPASSYYHLVTGIMPLGGK